MLYLRVNRSLPEKVFIVVMNSWSSASLTNGQAVMWDYPTDADGVGVTRPTARATSAGCAVAGVAAETIVSGDHGLIQVWGFHSAVRMRTMTSNTVLIVAGTPLALNSAGSVFCFESYETGADKILIHNAGFSFGANSLFTTSAVAAFLKCL